MVAPVLVPMRGSSVTFTGGRMTWSTDQSTARNKSFPLFLPAPFLSPSLSSFLSTARLAGCLGGFEGNAAADDDGCNARACVCVCVCVCVCICSQVEIHATAAWRRTSSSSIASAATGPGRDEEEEEEEDFEVAVAAAAAARRLMVGLTGCNDDRRKKKKSGSHANETKDKRFDRKSRFGSC